MITDQEIADLLDDATKEIAGDIHWAPSATHDGAQEFTVAVQSAAGWPLRIEAWLNQGAQKLSLALIHEDAGRIVGLDLGPTLVHHNPVCRKTRAAKLRCDCPRGSHIQIWSEAEGTERAVAVSEITAAWDDPIGAWQQFCAMINVRHSGILQEPER